MTATSKAKGNEHRRDAAKTRMRSKHKRALAHAAMLIRRQAAVLERSYTTPPGVWPDDTEDNKKAHAEFEELVASAAELELMRNPNRM